MFVYATLDGLRYLGCVASMFEAGRNIDFLNFTNSWVGFLFSETGARVGWRACINAPL